MPDLWRALPWRPAARPREQGGALWFARELQGAGRHDNPDLYGCMYASESPLSPVLESLAAFRGAGALTQAMLIRAQVPLALARLSLAEGSRLIDLDDPHALLAHELRPSQVATAKRAVTQPWAARLFQTRPSPAGLRWWSTLEASLVNLTLFDRAADAMAVVEVTPLGLDHPVVREAAEMLGLRV